VCVGTRIWASLCIIYLFLHILKIWFAFEQEGWGDWYYFIGSIKFILILFVSILNQVCWRRHAKYAVLVGIQECGREPLKYIVCVCVCVCVSVCVGKKTLDCRTFWKRLRRCWRCCCQTPGAHDTGHKRQKPSQHAAGITAQGSLHLPCL